jgi:hypothetical protein
MNPLSYNIKADESKLGRNSQQNKDITLQYINYSRTQNTPKMMLYKYKNQTGSVKAGIGVSDVLLPSVRVFTSKNIFHFLIPLFCLLFYSVSCFS